MPIPVNCPECNTLFSVSPIRLKRAKQVFCSMSCRAKSRAREMGVGKHMVVTCQQCDKSFTAHTCHIKQGRRKYCSLACRNAAKRSELPRCVACGNATSKIRRKYCSANCRDGYQKGENNRNWRGGKIVVMCNICGKEFEVARSVFSHGYGKFCSRDCMAIYKGQNASESSSRSRGGRRDDLNGLYVRSAWEANYARYLNWLLRSGGIEKWEYEPETFEFKGIKRGVRFYTPDFRITNNDRSIEYHEIKGWMDAKSAVKLKRMAKYHPTIKVVLIDEPVYKALAKSVKCFIPEWESYGKH
jgi:hypothetical protein